METPRYFPAATATRTIGAATYHMVKSEVMGSDYRLPQHHDQVFRAVIKRVEDLAVTTHVVYVAVDNEMRGVSLAQDKDQPFARELRATAMTGYSKRKADARFEN